jgi:glycosyltransferase involved in cell wall biosynthesis
MNGGLLYLLDLLEANPHMQLVIPSRDKKVDEFIHEARKRGVESRIELLDIRSTEELINMYDRADFVAFTAQKRVTKDVPNSLLDGFMRGKPALVSTAIDFHTIVSEHDIGIVIPVGAPAERLIVTPERYAQMANNAYHYAKNHTQGAYLDISKQLQ